MGIPAKPLVPLTADQQALATQWMRFAYGLSVELWNKKRYIKTRISDEEAISAGYVGLCRAAQLWDSSRGSFGAYLARAVKTHIYRAADCGGSVTMPNGVACSSTDPRRSNRYFLQAAYGSWSMSVDDFRASPASLPARQASDVEDREQTETNQQLLQTLLARLRPRERYVIAQLYFAGRTQEDIGKEQGVTRAMIHYVAKSAMQKLRRMVGIEEKEQD